MRLASSQIFWLVTLLGVVLSNIQGQQPGSHTAVENSCKYVTVTGAVRSPSRFELLRKVRLGELLVASGGLLESAGKTVRVTHAIPGGPCDVTASESANAGSFQDFRLTDVLRGDVNDDPFLSAGDVVNIQALNLFT